MVPADSVDDAVNRYNQGQADVVVGWEPNIEAAGKTNGTKLIGSDKLHVIVDVIMTARQTIKQRPTIVQAFHNAWFRTLKAQFEGFAAAAKQIADWGHNDWSGISEATAEKDLGSQLALVAQATLTENASVMSDVSRLTDRLTTAQRIWAAAGQTPASGPVNDLVNGQFVLAAVTHSELTSTAQPPNTSFLLASHPDLKAIAPDEGETLAVLPCRKFDFLPESIELTKESLQLLDTCVLPVLNSSTGIYLKVVGSAAWPGPVGTFTAKDITYTAMARAQAVVTYLTNNGIDPKRFSISTVLPPVARQNTTDGLEQAKDRYVEMTLITIGR
jgi:hypothetical protein